MLRSNFGLIPLFFRRFRPIFLIENILQKNQWETLEIINYSYALFFLILTFLLNWDIYSQSIATLAGLGGVDIFALYIMDTACVSGRICVVIVNGLTNITHAYTRFALHCLLCFFNHSVTVTGCFFTEAKRPLQNNLSVCSARWRKVLLKKMFMLYRCTVRSFSGPFIGLILRYT